MFLSETWSRKARLERIKNTLDFDGLFTVPNDGRGVDWLFCGKVEIWCGWIVSQNIILMS